MIECALAYYSNCPRAVRPTLFEEFLSFLVSKFVKLCQNDGDPVKGGNRVPSRFFSVFFFFVFGHCVASSFLSLFFSFYIRFAPRTREKRLSSIRALLLLVCSRALVSQPGISGSRNCKSLSELRNRRCVTIIAVINIVGEEARWPR